MKEKKRKKSLVGWAGFYMGKLDTTIEQGTDESIYSIYTKMEVARSCYQDVRKVRITVEAL